MDSWNAFDRIVLRSAGDISDTFILAGLLDYQAVAEFVARLPYGRNGLTGFSIASRLSRERQPIEPPEALTGTLAYMAPEQTGRMNRSIDLRSDLYALGVTFYQMLTGVLPFAAADPMELVHCHLARRPVAPADRVKVIPSRRLVDHHEAARQDR